MANSAITDIGSYNYLDLDYMIICASVQRQLTE